MNLTYQVLRTCSSCPPRAGEAFAWPWKEPSSVCLAVSLTTDRKYGNGTLTGDGPAATTRPINWPSHKPDRGILTLSIASRFFCPVAFLPTSSWPSFFRLFVRARELLVAHLHTKGRMKSKSPSLYPATSGCSRLGPLDLRVAGLALHRCLSVWHDMTHPPRMLDFM